MRARNFADQRFLSELPSADSWFNGAVDANLGYTVNGHHTHDLGMVMDLGINPYVNMAYQNSTSELSISQQIQQVAQLFPIAWSNDKALALSETLIQLPDGTITGRDNQRAAIRDFLSLYSVTQKVNGSRDNVRNLISNGTTLGRKEDIVNALFGDGSANNGLISNIHIGQPGFNTYPNMRNILEKLGIKATAVEPHRHHFHIYLRPPTVVNIAPAGANLLAEYQDSTSTFNASTESANLIASAARQKYDLTISTCSILEMDPSVPFPGLIVPAAQLANYYALRSKQPPMPMGDAKVNVLQEFRHGTLVQVQSSEVQGPSFIYKQNDPTYFGKDQAVFEIEYQGKRIRLFQNVRLGAGLGTDTFDESRLSRECNPNKIHRTSDGDNVITRSLDLVGDPSSELVGWLNAGLLNDYLADMSGSIVVIDELPGAIVGQMAASENRNVDIITLDTNAAGHGWFIDTTPGDNEEFLPTSNPNEWVARPGSAAEGKMDMRSVLMHEYGHVLGLEHSADGHDVMAAVLRPGVRRIWSAQDMADLRSMLGMSSVAGLLSAPPGRTTNDGPNRDPDTPLPTGGSSSSTRLGRARNSRFDALNDANDTFEARNTLPQYDIAANATLSNLDTSNGWLTRGNVSVAGGVAILSEVSNTQTRLNQVFMVGPNDRYLTFTVNSTVLDDQANGPDDAFEVGLLNANTGASLAGPIGLTHSDALLNLQADGSEFAATGVSHVTNPDGSRTYLVDLSGIASGTAVNLSFDLIGFAQNSSRATLRDMRLVGNAETRDDNVVTTEDTPVEIAALTNDIVATQAGFVPVLVTNAAHGQVVVNANGTFSYTPANDYFGGDSFTYQLSNGTVNSNIATVSVNVTPVNDTPVAADVSLTTPEDASLRLNILAQAHDVDSATLTGRIVSGPSHGTLTANADGSFSYTPSADFNGTDRVTFKVNDGQLDSNLATVNITVTPVNDAAVAANDSATLDEDTEARFDVLANDQDIDSTTLTTILVAGPQHGRVTHNNDGSFTYTADANFNGSDSFTYQVNDGELDSNVATVNLVIMPVNDAPIVPNLTVSLDEDTPLPLNLLTGATDVDNDPLSIVSVGTPSHGHISRDAQGHYVYIPNANFNGSDSLTFAVTDGQATVSATVTLTIRPVNDAPVAADDSVTTAIEVDLYDLAARGLAKVAMPYDANGKPTNVTASTYQKELNSVGWSHRSR